MKRERNPKTQSPSDRASNPLIPWLHGLAAMGDERWDEAITAIRRFLTMETKAEDRRTAYQNLANCYLGLENYDEALVALNEAEHYAPDDADILQGRGVTYACAARFPEAIAALELLSRRWPQQARSWKVQDTIRQLRRAQQGKISPGTYRLEYLQDQVIHSTALGDFARVEQKARQMISADPRRPEGHFALGLACLKQDRYQEALAAFLTAHTHDPKYEPTLYNIGHTYLQLDEPAQAITWLERALRQDSKHLEALHQLGVACERLERREEAVTWWRRALRFNPNYYPAQQRLHEVGQGPAPVEPLLPPASEQLRTFTPIVKARMKHPVVHRQGGVSLTFDPRVGYVLEDKENIRNGTIHAGGPFQTAQILDEDLLDLIGLVKLLLRMIDGSNTRDVAVLVYYASHSIFNYQARYQRGKRVEFDTHGQFIVNEVPRFFKLRIDSDLSTPYGNPMRGTLIYLNQHPESGFLLTTLGLASK